ncbi:hypothetical protein BBP40_001716 [Aspergillus hancockii]|nr:hypothetical protein BBP40_001716 [Aspergillus hancockii]
MSALHLKLTDDDPWIIEQKIFDLLNDYLQLSSPRSALSTANTLDTLFPTNRPDQDQPKDEPKEEPESFLWHMWPLIHRIAQRIPHSHPSQEKLAELVKTLKTLTSKTPTVHIWGSYRKLWADLPLLGPTLREEIDPAKKAGRIGAISVRTSHV